MSEQFFDQSSPLSRVKCSIETQQPSTPLQAISRHLQFIHRVHILDVHLDAWSIRHFGRPKVQVFVSPRFEI